MGGKITDYFSSSLTEEDFNAILEDDDFNDDSKNVISKKDISPKENVNESRNDVVDESFNDVFDDSLDDDFFNESPPEMKRAKVIKN